MAGISVGRVTCCLCHDVLAEMTQALLRVRHWLGQHISAQGVGMDWGGAIHAHCGDSSPLLEHPVGHRLGLSMSPSGCLEPVCSLGVPWCPDAQKSFVG